MTRVLGVGIVGAGNISKQYLTFAPLFGGLEIRACADIEPAAAAARGEEFGVRAETVDGLMTSDDVDLVINLTVPSAHYSVSRKALECGKHVYSEKPFVLTVSDGRNLAEVAERNNVRIGSAPDTFLGGAHQLVRRLIDSGEVGTITSGTCHVMSHGMEDWHPNPDFFYKPGAGPILDVGPYYVTNLVQLIGPVKRVMAISSMPSGERTITSEPRRGETVKVETPTTIHAIMEFESGAVVTFNASWDVWRHDHNPMELYGETGTVYVPDPNFFGGDVIATSHAETVENPPEWDHPLAVPNDENGTRANYRGVGVADMADAILEDRPHRCSMELALHAVEVMTSILKSGETGKPVTMQTTCQRPDSLPPSKARTLLAG